MIGVIALNGNRLSADAQRIELARRRPLLKGDVENRGAPYLPEPSDLAPHTPPFQPAADWDSPRSARAFQFHRQLGYAPVRNIWQVLIRQCVLRNGEHPCAA